MFLITTLNGLIKKLFVVDDDPEKTLKILFKINYWLMLMVSRDIDEYCSGRLSRGRIFMVDCFAIL